jgi:hypothetical protein
MAPRISLYGVFILQAYQTSGELLRISYRTAGLAVPGKLKVIHSVII